MGWLNDNDVNRIVELYVKCNLPVKPPKELSSEQIMDLMSVDKKNIDGQIRVILLKKIGEATLPIGVEKNILLETLDNYGR